MGNDVKVKERITHQRSSHVARPRFYRRTEEYVALMPITLAGRVVRKRGKEEKLPARHLKVGEKFKANELRLHVLKYLFLRGRVGPAGHPWTERAIQRVAARHDQAVKAKVERLKAKAEERVEVATEAATKSTESVVEEMAPEKLKPKPASNARRRGPARPKS